MNKEKIIKWFRSSLEEENGIASSRRLTAFWFVILATVIVGFGIAILYRAAFYKGEINSEVLSSMNFLEEILYIICGTILLLFGVTTAQNITGILKEGKKDDTKPTDKPAEGP